jgi:hypothetical protein
MASSAPGIRVHNFNLARASATVDDLFGQAQEAVSLRPRPHLVLVQIMDDDIVCSATARDYATFRAKLVKALDVLATGGALLADVPRQPVRDPTNEWQTYSPAERRAAGGTGPCDYLNPAGKVVRWELDRLARIIRGYEAQLAAGCARVRHCTCDGGAFARRPRCAVPG